MAWVDIVELFSATDEALAAPDSPAGGNIIDARGLFGQNSAVTVQPGLSFGFPQHLTPIWQESWQQILGIAAAHPHPTAPTQGQINKSVGVSLANIQGEVKALNQVAFNYAENAINYANSLQTVVSPAVQRALNGVSAALNGEIQALVGNAVSFSQSVLTQAETFAHNLFDQAESYAHTLYGWATDHTNTVWADAYAYTDKAKAAAESYAHTLYGWATLYTEQVGQDAEAYAKGLFTTAESDLTQAKNVLEGEISNGVAGAEATAKAYTDQVGLAVKTDVLGQVTPQLQALKAEQDECLTPLCDTVTPNANQLGKLGNLLKGFEGLAVPGLLLALVAEAVADPQAAAGQIETALGWTDSVAVDLVDAVVG